MPTRQTPGDKGENRPHPGRSHPRAAVRPKPAYLAVAVLDDHQHRGVLALHRPVQRLNAHAVLRGAESQRPRVADRPWREIFGELEACVEAGNEKEKEQKKERKKEIADREAAATDAQLHLQ